MSTNSSLQVRISNRGLELNTQRFSDDAIYIGRDPESDIYLDNPGVSRRHAKIQRIGDGFLVFDLNSGNGTFVNERKINHARLASGDVIRISKFTLELKVLDPEAGEPSSPPSAPGREVPPVPDVVEANDGETVFLMPHQQLKINEQAKAAEQVSEAIRSGDRASQPAKRGSTMLIFMAGAMFGVLCIWLLT